MTQLNSLTIVAHLTYISSDKDSHITVTYVRNHCVCGQNQRRIILQEDSNRAHNLLQSTLL